MTGICSAHRNHEPGCPACEATGGVMNEQEEARILAEKVMGWTVKDSKRLYYDEPCLLIADWHPRTNIAQAMMVAEAVKDCLHLVQHGEEGRWAAMFCGLMKDMKEWCNADTPAAAICAAAIKVGKEEG